MIKLPALRKRSYVESLPFLKRKSVKIIIILGNRNISNSTINNSHGHIFLFAAQYAAGGKRRIVYYKARVFDRACLFVNSVLRS